MAESGRSTIIEARKSAFGDIATISSPMSSVNGAIISLLFVLMISARLALAVRPRQIEPNRKVEESTGNTLAMDDHFEYAIADYGIGRLEGKPSNRYERVSPEPIFWLKLRIKDASEHLIGTPRYDPESVLDNWGNTYRLLMPGRNVGWNTSAIPRIKWDEYKPGESSVQFYLVPAKKLVDHITAIRVYLDRWPGNDDWHFFEIRNPMLRSRNIAPGMRDPDPSVLKVAVGGEK